MLYIIYNIYKLEDIFFFIYTYTNQVSNLLTNYLLIMAWDSLLLSTIVDSKIKKLVKHN